MTHDPTHKSIARKIVDSLSEPVMEGTTPASAEAPAPPVVISSYSEFQDTFSRLLTAQSSVVAGKLHLINLSRLRELLGERWDRVKWMVHQTAEKIIERHLKVGDVYARYQDSAYYVLFPRLSLEEAQLKCAIIAQEIAKHLLGQGDGLEAVEVRPVVVQVDRNAARADGNPTEAMTRLTQQTELHRKLRDLDGSDGISINSLSSLDYVDFIYIPMWNTSSKLVSTYLCTLMRRAGDGVVPLYDGDFLMGDAGLRAQIDLINLSKVVAIHHDLAKRGRRMILGVPVCFNSLAANDIWLKYHELCRGIPLPSRQLTIFEIMDLPLGVSQMRLYGIVQLLKPMARAVIARTTLDRTDFSSFAESGLLAVGANVREHTGREAQIISEMERFCEGASRHGLRTYVHGVNSLSLATAAACAGFTYVSGDAVTSISEAPEGVYPLETEQLYSHLLAATR